MISKLSKFENLISLTEAAALLSQLIGEKVFESSIRDLCNAGWITGELYCYARIEKLAPVLDSEGNEESMGRGGRIMKLEEPGYYLGLCEGFDVPSHEVFLEGVGSVYVLGDKDGGLYALRDEETEEFIGLSCKARQPNFNELGIAPGEIYALAKLANNDEPAEKPKRSPRLNEDCEFCYIPLYNLPPDNDRLGKRVPTTTTQQTQDSPSYVLAVAALVEIATSGSTKKHNQTSLIGEILDKYDLRGLSKSNLEKIFSTAKRKLDEARTTKH